MSDMSDDPTPISSCGTVNYHLEASLAIVERNLSHEHRDRTTTERLQILRAKILDAQAWLNYLYR